VRRILILGLAALLAVFETAKASTGWLAPNTTWQWQIQGKIDQSVVADMFDIDLFDARPGEINAGVIDNLHAKGKHVLCYLDTGAWESYRPDADEFPRSVIGNSTGWSGERYLDIRPQSWPLFEPIILRRLDLAVSLGCDGIEPDQNNSVENNPGFPITYADEAAWYIEVATQAHARGLTVVQKNGIELLQRPQFASSMVAAHDGMLNEECWRYRECDDGLQLYVQAGKWLGEVEYRGQTRRFCPELQRRGFMAMKKKLSLYAYREPCW
jgi:hypothetical protein